MPSYSPTLISNLCGPSVSICLLDPDSKETNTLLEQETGDKLKIYIFVIQGQKHFQAAYCRITN